MPLKDALRGTRFEDDGSMIRAVRTWLHEQEMSWYREGMHALVSHWRKAVDVHGDYLLTYLLTYFMEQSPS